MAEDGTLVSDDVQLHQVRRRRLVGALTVLVVVALGVVGAAVWSAWALILWPPLALLATIQLAGAGYRGGSRGGAGELRLTSTALAVTRYGEPILTVPRAAIEEGWIERYGDQAGRMTLVTPSVAVHAAVERDDATARDLLDALGLDARALRMTVVRTEGLPRVVTAVSLGFAVFFVFPTVTVTMALVVAFGDLTALIINPFLYFVLAVGIVVGGLAADALVATHLTIGEEGIEVRRWRRTRLLRFAHVQSVTRAGNEVTIDSGEGTRPMTIVCATAGMAYAVTTRVLEAVAAWRDAAVADHIDELDRGNATMGTWHERMRRLLERREDYRERTLGPELLWEVIDNPTATPERRVGATLALAARATDVERAKLRVAAARCAQPSLRVALEEAADGELEAEALEEAMKAYDDV